MTLELDDSLHNLRGGHLFGFGAADGARSDGACLVESCQDLAHATMTNEQLARDVARPDPNQSQLDDSLSDVQRQRTAIDK